MSTDTIGVFVNSHQQSVVVAFRGSASLQDWASNLAVIVPGRIHRSRSFQGALEVTRRVRDKYLLYESVLLTGHSRGGAIADFVGRKLGLPCATFNPATIGSAFQAHEPARLSITARTADVVSFLEVFFPADRLVVGRPVKNALLILLLPCLAAVFFALARLAQRSHWLDWTSADEALWLHWAAIVAAILTPFFFVSITHPVTNFTKR